MRVSHFCRYAFGMCAAVGILAGCGGGAQSPLAPSGSFQQRGAQPLSRLSRGVINTAGGFPSLGIPSAGSNDARSWMSTEAAKTKDLLYVSNLNQDSSGGYTVNVYSYPQGALMGVLKKDFSAPDGICVDKNNDVWIVNNGFSYGLVEYKHGGKSPIATLGRYAPSLIGCSVDLTTGDLAVTSYGTTDGSVLGSVSIYAHAKGAAKVYTDSEMTNMLWCGYDPKGNLYVDGLGRSDFAELPKGQKKFKNITLTGGQIYYPGNVQWDGKYVAVGDQQYLGGSPAASAIYQTTGSGGKIVGVTPFAGYQDVVEFWIQGNAVIGPDGSPDSNKVRFYNYPAGGKPTKTLTQKLRTPYGSAISE